MVHVRKLVLAIAAASALSSGMAQALVLGELTLKSTANQPLLAEIELRDVRDLTAAEVVPSLAPADAFARAGVNRDAYLNDLSFTPVINANGRSVIRVTSSQPMSAPLVKFLVQVVYPAGRLMRDYSVLVDPTRFSPQAAQAAQNAAQPAVTGSNANGQYTTTSRDTLWEIAARYRNGTSVQQTMLAIQALNPEAFIDANINRLKSGQILRLPDGQQSGALPQGEAIAEVARQNAAWRDGRRLGPRAQQLDATRRGSGNAPAGPTPEDRLSLVSGARSGATGAAGDARVLSDKLATTQEDLDATRRDNDELKSRNGDLQSQIDKLQKLIQLKNDQLARLQSAGIDVNAASPATAATTAPANPAGIATPTPAAPDVLDAGTGAAAEPEATAAQPAVSPTGEAATGAPAGVPEGSAPINAELIPAPVPAPTETPVEPPVAAAPAEVAPVEAAGPKPSFAERMRSNPVVYGLMAGGVVLLLLLGALLLARRRNALAEAEKHKRMAAALSEEPLYREEDFDLPPGSFDDAQTPPNVRLTPAAMAASAAAAQASAASTNAVYRPAPPLALDTPPSVASLVIAPAADDVLLEAERAIDHGRLNHAADILETAVAREPERSDLRLKLMEVYAQQGDRDAFVAEERQLVANGRNHAEAEALKTRYPAMLGAAALGLSAAAVAAELDAQYVKDLLNDTNVADDPEPIGEVFDTDFDLSLDGVDPLAADEAPVAEPHDDLDLPAEEAPARTADDDFQALLARSEAERQAAQDALDEFDLALDGDEPAPAPAAEVDELEALSASDAPQPPLPASRVEPDLSADFDLSLPDEDEVESQRFASELGDVNAELDRLADSMGTPPLDTGHEDLDDEFDFLAGTDEVTTKLDLARAYIEMQDADGARDILDEVVKEGSEAQRSEARKMLSSLA